MVIFVGELGSVETLMYIGLWGCVVGIVFLFYGWRIRHLAFPLGIMLVEMKILSWIGGERLRASANSFQKYRVR